jgi:hypothetical protein
MTEFTAADKQKAAEREAKMRRRVYPRWVDANKMTQETADREIAVMEAIACDYAALAEKERLL